MSKEDPTTEAEFLRNYDAKKYNRASTSVDTIIFTVMEEHLHVLLIKRSEHPFKDFWSLVGGYIDVEGDEDLIATAKRKLFEKTGVKTPYLEQFATVGNKDRDPRGWSVTTVYFALIPHAEVKLNSGAGASEIKWAPLRGGKVKDKLAFDHSTLLLKCWERLKSKVLYTSLPVHLMAKAFSLRELQNIYEIILEQPLDHKSFRRRILSVGILEETGKQSHESRRPAQLYRLKKSSDTHFFTRNIEGAHRAE